jgi:NADPH:quinone reductase-like Zn-dependent oxidoreductase
MSLPETMKGVVLIGHGGLDQLVWREDLPVPRPAEGDVLIRVGAAAVNNTDVNTRTGWYSKSVRGDTASGAAKGYSGSAATDGGWSGALTFPRIQGADCCGTIVAVGRNVDHARIGERVLVRPMHRPAGADDPMALATFGSERDGGFAEYTTAASVDAVGVNSNLTDIELASLPCAYSTAEGMIQRVKLGAGPIVELDLRTLYLRDLSLLGSTFQPASAFTDLVGYIEAGEVRPLVAKTYPLRELRAAQEEFLSKAHIGKIGIEVSG